MLERLDADLRARLALAPHVDVRGGVVADDDRREPRPHPLVVQRRDVVANAIANALRDRLAVDDPRAHLFFSGA